MVSLYLFYNDNCLVRYGTTLDDCVVKSLDINIYRLIKRLIMQTIYNLSLNNKSLFRMYSVDSLNKPKNTY